MEGHDLIPMNKKTTNPPPTKNITVQQSVRQILNKFQTDGSGRKDGGREHGPISCLSLLFDSLFSLRDNEILKRYLIVKLKRMLQFDV